VGKNVYWSRTDAGQGFGFTTDDLTEAVVSPCEFTVLPAGGYLNGGRILYVDDCDDLPAQRVFNHAFDALGIRDKVDRFDVLGASESLGNGLGTRVADVWQLINCYDSIIWSSGELQTGTIGDGSGMPEKSDDFQVLFDFLDQHPDTCGVYFSGDDLAEEWEQLTGPAATNLRTHYIDFSVVDSNHALAGEALAPALVQSGDGPNLGPLNPLVDMGCGLADDYSLMMPVNAATAAYTYPNGGDAAVLTQETANNGGGTSRVVLSGFSWHFMEPVPARVGHLESILNWFGEDVGPAVGARNTPRARNFLAQNYPNPFNPSTTIQFDFARRGKVGLRVYNVAGQLVRTLFDAEMTPKYGGHSVTWDGTNDAGETVSSGVYFYRLRTSAFSMTKKMVLLK